MPPSRRIRQSFFVASTTVEGMPSAIFPPSARMSTSLPKTSASSAARGGFSPCRLALDAIIGLPSARSNCRTNGESGTRMPSVPVPEPSGTTSGARECQASPCRNRRAQPASSARASSRGPGYALSTKRPRPYRQPWPRREQETGTAYPVPDVSVRAIFPEHSRCRKQRRYRTPFQWEKPRRRLFPIPPGCGRPHVPSAWRGEHSPLPYFPLSFYGAIGVSPMTRLPPASARSRSRSMNSPARSTKRFSSNCACTASCTSAKRGSFRSCFSSVRMM